MNEEQDSEENVPQKEPLKPVYANKQEIANKVYDEVQEILKGLPPYRRDLW